MIHEVVRFIKEPVSDQASSMAFLPATRLTQGGRGSTWFMTLPSPEMAIQAICPTENLLISPKLCSISRT